mmetsp:Transcript_90286/g.150960  ORF Transcript_90286/g.150960 Transcript_90286/m.150960 type:complete len:219 (+) Transcript_90286:2352-3008(+)
MLAGEPTAKGTGLGVPAGKEDPVEFDSSLTECSSMEGVAQVGSARQLMALIGPSRPSRLSRLPRSVVGSKLRACRTAEHRYATCNVPRRGRNRRDGMSDGDWGGVCFDGRHLCFFFYLGTVLPTDTTVLRMTASSRRERQPNRYRHNMPCLGATCPRVEGLGEATSATILMTSGTTQPPIFHASFKIAATLLSKKDLIRGHPQPPDLDSADWLPQARC